MTDRALYTTPSCYHYHQVVDPHYFAEISMPFESVLLPGLSYHESFIDAEQEARLLSGVHANPRAWKQLNKRTLQNWGGLPHIKGMIPTSLPPFLRPLCSQLVDRGVFPSSEAPNHVLVNRYEPGQGIAPHVDGPAYKPRAAIVSLQAPIVMDFYKIEDTPGISASRKPTASLVLRPRSLLVIAGDVYTSFYHSIAERESDTIDENVLNAEEDERGLFSRKERTSLTIRTSCKTIRNPLLVGLR